MARDRDPGAATRMNGMYCAVVVDIAKFRDLRARDPAMGAKRLAKALGCPLGASQALMRGRHWQQDPTKVRLFNEYKHASLDEATGEAGAEDLAAFGLSRAERRAAAAGITAVNLGGRRIIDDESEAVEALGVDDKPPLRLDTAYFQGTVDEVLWRLLRELSAVKIRKMSGREIAAAASAFLEKRALLRGEPTAIVRNDNRGSLEKIGSMLLMEIERREKAHGGERKMITIEAEAHEVREGVILPKEEIE